MSTCENCGEQYNDTAYNLCAACMDRVQCDDDCECGGTDDE